MQTHTHTHSHSWKEFTLASFSVVGNRQSGIFMLECGAIHPLYILLSINLDAKMSVRTQMYTNGGWMGAAEAQYSNTFQLGNTSVA